MSTMREDILRTTKSCTGPLASEPPKSSFPSRSSVSSTFAAGRWSTGRWRLAGHGRNAVTILIARGLVVEALRDEELGDLLAGDEVADDVEVASQESITTDAMAYYGEQDAWHAPYGVTNDLVGR